MRGIPTLGRRSKTEAIEQMLKDGRSREEIAGRLKTSPSRIGSIIHRMPRDLVTEVRVPTELVRALKPHAEARAVNTHELVRRLLAAIVADSMVGAILDDTETQCAEGARADRRTAQAAPAGGRPAREAQE